ncbi:protein draper [Magallana gigas]|uniref:protein draper n=1 Tax=Magallana gigas TaxID=29159 RepID=UPI00333FD83E
MCSSHCLDDSPCNKKTGVCDRGCSPGYINSDCGTECSTGYFGMNCRENCSGHCVNNESCDHVTGVCFNGCQDGYIGARCDEICKKGYYGKNCSLVCSPNCKTCRHTDGLCSCKAGWMGPNCTTECVWSFGENCQYPCGGYCIDQRCDRFNGSCLYGNCTLGTQQNDDSKHITPVTIAFIVGLSASVIVNIVAIGSFLLELRYT